MGSRAGKTCWSQVMECGLDPRVLDGHWGFLSTGMTLSCKDSEKGKWETWLQDSNKRLLEKMMELWIKTVWREWGPEMSWRQSWLHCWKDQRLGTTEDGPGHALADLRIHTMACQVVLVVKNPPASAGDIGGMGLIPGPGRSPGEGSGNPLHYSCLENPMDRGTWQAIVHGVTRVGHDIITKPPPQPV